MEMTVSDSLEALLIRQGMTRGAVGAASPRGKKSPGAASDGARGGSEANTREGGIEYSPIGRAGEQRPILVWSNPHMTKATGKRAALVMCR